MFVKYLTVLAFMAVSIGLSAQEPGPFCVPDRFTSQYIYPESDIVVQSDIEYGLSQTVDGVWEPQLMDIYNVNPALDTMTNRPLAVVLHGGGFKTGDKTDELVVESMLSLARSGYTAVTFNYRLGYDEPTGACSADPDDIHRAVYRAVQDGHAAMRFLFHNKDIYGIDTSFVFVGGLSAGATLASLIHYGTPAYFTEHFNWLPLELGPVNTSGNPLDDEFNVDGLIMAWGSFPPFLDLDADNAIPTINYHGAMDSTVPIGDGTFGSCPNYPMTVGPDLYIPAIEMAGACYDFNRNPNGGHGLEGNFSEFYVKNRTVCFMKTIMCDVCESSTQLEGEPTCPTLGTSINEFGSLTNSISLQRNPVRSEDIALVNSSDINMQLDIVITDLSGKAVYSSQGKTFVPGINRFNVPALRAGLYLIDLSDMQEGTGTLRLLIE